MKTFDLSAVPEEFLFSILENHQTRKVCDFLSKDQIVDLLNSFSSPNHYSYTIIHNLTDVLKKEDIAKLHNSTLKEQAFERYLNKAGKKEDFIDACAIDGKYLANVVSSKRSKEVVMLAINSKKLPPFSVLPKKFRSADSEVFKSYIDAALQTSDSDKLSKLLYDKWEEVLAGMIGLYEDDVIVSFMKRVLKHECIQSKTLFGQREWFAKNWANIYEKDWVTYLPAIDHMKQDYNSSVIGSPIELFWRNLSNEHKFFIGCYQRSDFTLEIHLSKHYHQWAGVEDVVELYFTAKERKHEHYYRHLFARYDAEIKLLSI